MNEMMIIKDAAKKAGVRRETILRAIKLGRIPSAHMCDDGVNKPYWKMKEVDVQFWIENYHRPNMRSNHAGK